MFVNMQGHQNIVLPGASHGLTQADGDYFRYAARSCAPQILAIIPDLMVGVKMAAGIVGCLAAGAAAICSEQDRSR